MSRHTKVTSTRYSGLKSFSRRLIPFQGGHILLADDFARSLLIAQPLQAGGVAVRFGLSASEGQCYRCPVSRPIPVQNQLDPASRHGGIFMHSTLLPRTLETSAHSFSLATSQLPDKRSHLCPKIKSATPSPIRK